MQYTSRGSSRLEPGRTNVADRYGIESFNCEFLKEQYHQLFILRARLYHPLCFVISFFSAGMFSTQIPCNWTLASLGERAAD